MCCCVITEVLYSLLLAGLVLQVPQEHAPDFCWRKTLYSASFSDQRLQAGNDVLIEVISSDISNVDVEAQVNVELDLQKLYIIGLFLPLKALI